MHRCECSTWNEWKIADLSVFKRPAYNWSTPSPSPWQSVVVASLISQSVSNNNGNIANALVLRKLRGGSVNQVRKQAANKFEMLITCPHHIFGSARVPPGDHWQVPLHANGTTIAYTKKSATTAVAQPQTRV